MEVLWFEDIEPLRQPVFDFPLLGRISMKQMGVIGSAMIIALASKDIVVAMVSLSLALFISMIRYRAVGIDELIYSLISYLIRHKVRPVMNALLKVLGVSMLSRIKPVVLLHRLGVRMDRIVSAGDSGDGRDDVLLLNSSNVRLRLRLLTRDGRVIENRLTKVYVDDTMIASITSDQNGELDIMFTADNSSKALLRVYVDGYSRPLLEKIIVVRSAR